MELKEILQERLEELKEIEREIEKLELKRWEIRRDITHLREQIEILN